MFQKIVIIHNIFTSPAHNYFTRDKFDVGDNPTISHSSMILKVGKGLPGDRFEDSTYPITFFSLEVASEVCKTMDIPLDIELFRRNIIISGIHLNSLIGKRFFIGKVEFEGLQHCSPCTWMNAVMKKGVYKEMIGRGGLRVKVISSGELKVGSAELKSKKELNINPKKALHKPNIPS